MMCSFINAQGIPYCHIASHTALRWGIRLPAEQLKAGIPVDLHSLYNKGYLSVSQHFAEE